MGQTIKMECVVDSVTKKEVHKKDTDKEEHVLVAMNKDEPFKVTITRPMAFLGYNAGDPVTIALKREQQTLDEAKKK